MPKVRTMKVPGKKVEVDRDRLVAMLKTELHRLPKGIEALKEADNSGWQEIMDEVTKFIREDSELSNLVRTKERDGVLDVSIGEPNWFLQGLVAAAAVVTAFGAGYAVGTVMYASGCADFTGATSGCHDPEPWEDDECEKDPNCLH